MQYLLDTNICIYLIKKKPVQVYLRLQQVGLGAVGISSITLSELDYGIEKSQQPNRNRMALAQFVAPLEIAVYDEQAARQYGQIRSHLERQGLPIGPLDMLIAAHARALGCALVTNNVREFERVPNLRVENWAEA